MKERLNEFNSSHWVEEEANMEHYDHLLKQKQRGEKNDAAYKRNYLLKLRELEALITSTSTHESTINEAELSLLNVNKEIGALSELIGISRKRDNTPMLKEQGRTHRKEHSVMDLPYYRPPGEMSARTRNEKTMTEILCEYVKLPNRKWSSISNIMLIHRNSAVANTNKRPSILPNRQERLNSSSNTAQPDKNCLLKISQYPFMQWAVGLIFVGLGSFLIYSASGGENGISGLNGKYR